MRQNDNWIINGTPFDYIDKVYLSFGRLNECSNWLKANLIYDKDYVYIGQQCVFRDPADCVAFRLAMGL